MSLLLVYRQKPFHLYHIIYLFYFLSLLYFNIWSNTFKFLIFPLLFQYSLIPDSSMSKTNLNCKKGQQRNIIFDPEIPSYLPTSNGLLWIAKNFNKNFHCTNTTVHIFSFFIPPRLSLKLWLKFWSWLFFILN